MWFSMLRFYKLLSRTWPFVQLVKSVISRSTAAVQLELVLDSYYKLPALIANSLREFGPCLDGFARRFPLATPPLVSETIPSINPFLVGVLLDWERSTSTSITVWWAFLDLLAIVLILAGVRDLLIAAEEVAKRTMVESRDILSVTLGIDEDGLIHEIGTYDGCYQKRSSKAGGGFSRYCFACIISSTTGRILAYDVACNSCSQCTAIDHLFESGAITRSEYDLRFSKHLSICQAEYRDFSSVSLESQLAPGILKKALDLGVIFDGIVSDGDNKTIETLRESNVYQSFQDHTIDRLECMAHVCKRMKTHLIEGQKDVIRKSKGEKETTEDHSPRERRIWG